MFLKKIGGEKESYNRSSDRSQEIPDALYQAMRYRLTGKIATMPANER